MNTNLFAPGRNCWRTSQVDHARVLIDCADYYRAIHEAVCRAKNSIFILGWEIDSQVRLLRGEDEKNSKIPSCIVDLLNWKATQNPELKIYLLRWNSSVAFVYERELLPEYAWTSNTPENLMICLDNTIPIGGSQHQKIILVDDELVFNGGMDIARQRWDERDHRVSEPERIDALGTYGPYHDVQMVMDGPVVDYFAEHVRWRWERAAGFAATPRRSRGQPQNGQTVPAWPTKFPSTVDQARCAIARTHPAMGDNQMVEEIMPMYLDLIRSAKKFIYLENQFFACNRIADALNDQLRLQPALKVLCVSSYNPQGILEREGLWAGRIEFNERMCKDIDPSRVRILCTGTSKPNGETLYKRIHAKVSVFDDHYLTVGSANINNRSMSLDTECDVTIHAITDVQREWIRHQRNDLIAEHSGFTIEQVAHLCDEGRDLEHFLQQDSQKRYSLRPIDDEQFTDRTFHSMAKIFADPAHPLLHGVSPVRNPKRSRIILISAAVLFFVVALFAARTFFHDVTASGIEKFMQGARDSAWGLPAVIGVYVVGGFFLFPVTVLSLITASIFGAIWGPVYAMAGALASASVTFFLGRWAGVSGIRKIMGARMKKIDQHFEKSGIIGVMLVRLIPIAPFTLVNLAAGVSSVTYINFCLGTFLAFLPAFIAKGLLGDSLTQVLLHPNPESTKYLILGVGVWLAIVGATYLVVKFIQKHKAHPA